MKFRYSRMLAALVVSAVMVAGCGSNQQQAGDVSVNAYKITASDAQVNQTYAGTVVAENSVAVHARVTGYVVEKYVKGGEQVVAGQPLYRIDSRQYEATLANAEAQAAQANANYKNAEVDLNRYETLAQQDAIAQQRVDTQRSIDMGTFVQAGSTTLVTIDSIDPIFVEFSMTEQEYLDFMKNPTGDDSNGPNIQLKLADGETYNQPGSIVQAAKSLDQSTGKLVLKASFPNPDHLLLPNMFATVISPGQKLKNAILVPSRAILQIMDKNFIFVVNADGVVEQKSVEVGGTSGSDTIIKAGLAPGDTIIVDGLTKVKNGVKVNAKLLSKEQLKATK
ncbi:MAG: efflux RND transporter periplasmic adaptor subunit [Veillonella sp.]|nr:efflux RND transporter periplasmic adaptor subunit [Veillonella sp.]